MATNYYQGDLDCLCGVYSAINAAKLVLKELRGDKAWELFYRCVKNIEKRKRLASDLTGGLPAPDLRALLRNVLAPKYEITVKRPFSRVPGIKLNPFLTEIRKFLEGGGNRAVIVCFAAGWELPHWSVIRSVSKTNLVLLDSAGWNKIRKKECTTWKATTLRKFLFATQDTYFLMSNE